MAPKKTGSFAWWVAPLIFATALILYMFVLLTQGGGN